MRIAAPSRRRIASATSTTAAAMSFSSRPPIRGRRPWGRGFCSRPPYWDGRGEGGAFVSGESHLQTVRDANYGHRQGYGGNFAPPWRWSRPQFYPRSPPPVFRPSPRPRPVDFRSWVPSTAPLPPPQCVRFRVLSYNILADYLARDHRSKLYFHIPPYILDWEWRKRRLLIEFGLWSPDIMCLQEVDRFQDLEEELATQGYNGAWKMRTGNAVDGCAIFWRTNRFVLRHEEHIEFNKLGLRDNVAQICVLESRSQRPAENTSAPMPASGGDQVVVCNIHVLYNPKRGEIKLGQVRVLLDRAYSVSRVWNDAPLIICGDFNATPKSPLYNFISEQKLNLSGLARNKLSGQYSAYLGGFPPNLGYGLYRAQPSQDKNVVEAAAVEQGNYHSGISNQKQPQKDVQNSPPKDISSYVSEQPCSYSQNFTESDPMVKVLCERETLDVHNTEYTNRHLPKEATEGIYELSKVAGDMKIKEEQLLASSAVSCDDNHFSGEGEPDHADKDANISGSCRGMTMKEYSESNPDISDEHVDSLHLDLSYKNEELIDASSVPLGDMNNGSKFYRRDHTLQTLQEHFGDASLADDCETTDAYGKLLGKITEYASSQNTDCHGIFMRPHPGEAIQCTASGELPSSQLEDVDCSVSEIISESYSSFCGQGDKVLENTDSNFLKELHGTEDIYQFREEIVSCTSFSRPTLSSSLLETQETRSFSPALVKGVGYEEINFVRPDSAITQQEELEFSGIDNQKNIYDPYLWTPMEIEAASGNAERTVVEHNLKLTSAYTEVEDIVGTKESSREPQVTSYHRQFMGTVDYIWHSEGIQTVEVLDTIPKHVLQQTPGFPTKKWGSDHLAIACEFAFTKGLIE